MAYLDPASNPGSKPQRLGAANCKSSTSDKLQTFRTIFGISLKFLTKNYLHEITPFVLFVTNWQELIWWHFSNYFSAILKIKKRPWKHHIWLLILLSNLSTNLFIGERKRNIYQITYLQTWATYWPQFSKDTVGSSLIL